MLQAILVLSLVGLVFGTGLAVASRYLAVRRDERLEAIEAVLPGANCGACGSPGCGAFASAVLEGDASPGACTVGGSAVAQAVADILGVEVDTTTGARVAHIHCQGGRDDRSVLYVYDGPVSCQAMQLLGEGDRSCGHGCLHGGTCHDVCPFDAITVGADGLPVVDRELCTACGLCVDACPRDIIHLVPADRQLLVSCSHTGKARDVRAVCKVGCLACGMCVRACPNEAWSMGDDNLPVLDADRCTLAGACLEKCPTKVIVRGVEQETAAVV